MVDRGCGRIGLVECPCAEVTTISDRVSRGATDSHRRLSACYRKRLDHGARRRFPEPIADLIVKCLDVIRLDDPRVIAQSVEQLRPVGPLPLTDRCSRLLGGYTRLL